jgi:hypothetical protein
MPKSWRSGSGGLNLSGVSGFGLDKLPFEAPPAAAKPHEVAPFLRSLRRMLESESDEIIRWTPDGHGPHNRRGAAHVQTLWPAMPPDVRTPPARTDVPPDIRRRLRRKRKRDITFASASYGRKRRRVPFW